MWLAVTFCIDLYGKGLRTDILDSYTPYILASKPFYEKVSGNESVSTMIPSTTLLIPQNNFYFLDKSTECSVPIIYELCCNDLHVNLRGPSS